MIPLMIFPCRCRGSIKFVHDKCLKDWISSRYNYHPYGCHTCCQPWPPSIEKSSRTWRLEFVRVVQALLLVVLIVFVVCISHAQIQWSLQLPSTFFRETNISNFDTKIMSNFHAGIRVWTFVLVSMGQIYLAVVLYLGCYAMWLEIWKLGRVLGPL